MQGNSTCRTKGVNAELPDLGIADMAPGGGRMQSSEVAYVRIEREIHDAQQDISICFRGLRLDKNDL